MSDRPYPGLRPFTREESYLFFGREEQTDQLLKKLADHRFLSVVGLSGCGKSSLVRAGMIAALESGYLASAGAHWRTAIMRPGDHPLINLAKALLHDTALKQERSHLFPPESQTTETLLPFLLAALRRGPLGLAEIVRETPLPANTNLLILVDQFEELFRYHQNENRNEIDAFVSLLLASAQHGDVPIYIVITLRSDFIGECAKFQGLPEMINDGQFLVPRLTRDQQRLAITCPAEVFGSTVESRLVNHLLNEMGNDPDQLPVLQHCLMRMWYQAKEKTSDRQEMTLTFTDYETVGGVKNALSNHVDEAFQELTPVQQTIAETLFRRITERSPDWRDKRHPVPLREISTVAQVPTTAVAAVVDTFRRADRCFLTPSLAESEQLQDETMIDISHESLIRQWRKLNIWVAQEAESAEIYGRLEQTASLWQQGKSALWGTPDLENALHWKDRVRPTPAWAARYGTQFDLAMKFLDASRRRKFWIRCFTVVLPLLILIVALVFTNWVSFERSRTIAALQQTIVAEEHAKKAQEQAEHNSSSFQAMVNATFGFLADSRKTEEFLDWAKQTAIIKRLYPALDLMIDLSKKLDADRKTFWHTSLSEMADEHKLELLNILGTEAAENVKFRILQVVIQDAQGMIITPETEGYTIKVGQTVTIRIEIANPAEHPLEFQWKAYYGKLSAPNSSQLNTYAAETIGSDVVIVRILNRKTGEEIDSVIINLMVVQ